MQAMKLTLALLILGVGLAAQTDSRHASAVKKTPWGDPDLQGIWNSSTSTPLQRDPKFGLRTTLTDQEFQEAQKQAERRQQGETEEDRRNSKGVGAGPTFWYEVGTPLRRTSLIIDPPDGRLPPLTPEAQNELAELQKLENEPRLDSSLWEKFRIRTRCIARGVPAIMHPTTYNNNYQIVQTPGYVAIYSEMIHETRIIPLDKRSHVDSAIKLWGGDARGHWEGETLVVESTNYHPESQPMVTASLRGGEAKVVERFTRIGPT